MQYSKFPPGALYNNYQFRTLLTYDWSAFDRAMLYSSMSFIWTRSLARHKRVYKNYPSRNSALSLRDLAPQRMEYSTAAWINSQFVSSVIVIFITSSWITLVVAYRHAISCYAMRSKASSSGHPQDYLVALGTPPATMQILTFPRIWSSRKCKNNLNMTIGITTTPTVGLNSIKDSSNAFHQRRHQHQLRT